MQNIIKLHIIAKLKIANKLIVKLKSEKLKNVHLKPDIRYTTGLNIDIFMVFHPLRKGSYCSLS